MNQPVSDSSPDKNTTRLEKNKSIQTYTRVDHMGCWQQKFHVKSTFKNMFTEKMRKLSQDEIVGLTENQRC